ncbi:hypothetical protein [Helicobacter burdigaliensis]|uniref:hypothetical protein n=1 Tax=Helicobacter burdigaliensis TaxID=2315334 RepID=UPI000EF74F47|nr:hypothetical protein [Helicobacter burdigaliensis]
MFFFFILSYLIKESSRGFINGEKNPLVDSLRLLLISARALARGSLKEFTFKGCSFRLLRRFAPRNDRVMGFKPCNDKGKEYSLLQKNSRGDFQRINCLGSEWEEFTYKFRAPTSRLRELLLNKEFRRVEKLKRNGLDFLVALFRLPRSASTARNDKVDSLKLFIVFVLNLLNKSLFVRFVCVLCKYG